VAQRPGIVAETKGSSTMCLRGSVRGGAAMDYPWNTKSVEQMVEEMNMALRESRTMSEQEKIEFDAEFGYTPDETSDTEDSEGCDDMDEIKVSNIGNKDIPKLKNDDIMAVALAESGAMGEAGALNIICKKRSKVKIYHANYCFGDFDLDKFTQVFTPLKTFDCGVFGNVSGVAEGWDHIYMGMGNHLLLRDTIAGAFKAEVWEKSEAEIYGCYMEVAVKVLGGEA
jgi:hypothetical protein